MANGAGLRLTTEVSLAELVGYLDEYLRIKEVPDEANAVNGLQVETPAGYVGSSPPSTPPRPRSTESSRRSSPVSRHPSYWCTMDFCGMGTCR